MRTWIIGSGADCDLVVAQPTVSGRHCRLAQTGAGYVLEDLGSSNGTYVNGVRITSPTRVTPGDTVTLGLTAPMPWPSESSSRAKGVLRIGREPDNDLVVDLPVVSGHHARVIWEGEPGRAIIEDLGSSNGTAVGSPELKITLGAFSTADTIYLGSHPLPAAFVMARLNPRAQPTLPFRGSPTVIGRDAGCDQVIDLPMVSGRHARLVRVYDQIFLEDLGSSNGTFVNGRRIDRDAVVRAGDVIGLGSHTLVLTEELPEAAADDEIPALEESLIFAPVQAPPPLPLQPPPLPWSPPPLEQASPGKPTWRVAALILQAVLVSIAIVAAFRGNTPTLLFWVGLASIWFGLSDAVLGNLIDATQLREGLKPEGAVRLVSRLGVLIGTCALQCVLAWTVVAVATGLNASPLPTLALLILASAVGLAMGLLIVAIAPRPEASWASLAVIMLMLWIFGGGQTPLSRMPSWAGAVANALPSRWAFEGLLLQADHDPSPAVPEGSDPARDLAEDYFPADSERMGTRADAMALGFMLIGLVAAATFISGVGRSSR